MRGRKPWCERAPGQGPVVRHNAVVRHRDRDPQGRARNARPRDGLGRPLPYGSPGVERIDEELVLTPQESLELAQRLLDEGRPFHAHEVLEAAWKNSPAGERMLWKGLAQLAVGLTHVRRGNPVGAVALLHRAGEHLQPYAEQPPHGVAADHLIRAVADLCDRLERDGLPGITDQQLSPPLRATTG
ncbi:DUF309 domain-containing protein [Saccharopolyspora sp. ASAGF58]|nr:DUF309 domain-containing protein [Saccharopolyspora sp. ASAGF58]